MTTTSIRTRATTTTDASAPVSAPPVRTGWVSALRTALRTRRAGRSELSRQIAAYPATRGVAVTVLPSARAVPAPAHRF